MVIVTTSCMYLDYYNVSGRKVLLFLINLIWFDWDSSKQTGDGLHLELEVQLEQNPELTVNCHRSCVSSYVSTEHIARYRNKCYLSEGSDRGNPAQRRRSEICPFVFKKHCIFCGQECLPPDPKNPGRWKEISQCQTADRPGQKSFKEKVLEQCDKRRDQQAEEVRIRISGATSDLHAADGQYRRDCYKRFFHSCNVQASIAADLQSVDNEDLALSYVIKPMNKEYTRIWNSVQVYDIYRSYWRYVIYRPSIRTVASGIVGVVVVVVVGVCNRSQMRTTNCTCLRNFR